jgi:cardiolipin synthase
MTPSTLWSLFLSAVILQAIIVGVTVVMERRSPSASLAWLLTLILLPGLGVLLYGFIGRRAMRRARRRRIHAKPPGLPERACCMPGNLDALAPPPGGDLFRLGIRAGGYPVTHRNRVEHLRDAKAFYPRLEEAVAAARESVRLMFYIYRGDQAGERLLHLLCAKAAEGVEVRLLVDGWGSFGLEPSFLAPLLDAHARFAYYLPPRIRLRSSRLNFRNHRKLVCVDGRVGFVGGINVGNEYLGQDPYLGAWRDTMLRVEGPAVAAMEEVFIKDWSVATGEVLEATAFPSDGPGEALVQVLPSDPGDPWQPIRTALFQGIVGARRRAWLTTPYFVPDESLRTALLAGGLRGADIRILVPGRSDMRFVRSAGRSYYSELLEAGVRIYEYQAGFVHAKTLLVDDAVASVGSANMDIRSFELNHEVNVLVSDATLVAQMEREFLRDVDDAVEITAAEWEGRPYLTRLKENTARLLSPLL